MFYKIITKKRDEWLNQKDCPIKNLMEYIILKGEMRDAQIDAIKTYLFLKIEGKNCSLYELVTQGFFNTINIDELEISTSTRNYLSTHKEAVALYEYASQEDSEGNVLSKNILKAIKENPASIDYNRFFKDLFYNVSYTDYLFSLPMGAGKTYLMATFIYLDLYFANNEPDNKAFAHNFIVFAPSGLKTSVVPSLRTIQKFDPSWILPEPSASNLKKQLIFEVLDQNKSEKNSNRTRNPNVQKIAIHQPLNELFGLVAITNAEKVILDRIEDRGGQISFLEDSSDGKDRQANELRNLIGKIPNLSIFIDEVHHATSETNKLRAVVNRWATKGTVNGVIGFSGTPYLQTKEKIEVTNEIALSSIEISNIVYYYPISLAIGNFLKKPTVKISSSENKEKIVEDGVREFLDNFKDKIYSDGTCAKLGIYCGSIENLEEVIYPLVERIVSEYGLSPSETILKFHDGNKKYAEPVDAYLNFVCLDNSSSKFKIILLVGIGKEGWDCKSLTGIILSQEGDCPTNMVLQTSCRCLRQIEKGVVESALIYLNKFNADTLNIQLQQQHHISIEEFEKGVETKKTILKCYDRTKYLKLPKVDFYQFKVDYITEIVEKSNNIAEKILKSADNEEVKTITEIAEIGQQLNIVERSVDNSCNLGEIANFNIWLHDIVKESFNNVNIEMLNKYLPQLRIVFEKITIVDNEICYFNKNYNLQNINANIRKAFYDKRSFKTKTELLEQQANLLHIENFKEKIATSHEERFYPKQDIVEKIILDDNGELIIDSKTEQMIKMLNESGNVELAEKLMAKNAYHDKKDKSFHYLPYRTDSNFEIEFLEKVLTIDYVKNNNLEVYYNGDGNLTEFRIKCYKQSGERWNYIGLYTPDFLIIQRKDNKIYKAIIVETKGVIYKDDERFIDKKSFVEQEFLSKNNEQFGYNRFDYLYLEDSLSNEQKLIKTSVKIKDFFKE